MPGRRTICTPELTETICDHIASGLSNKDAIKMSGISDSIFYEWIARGERERRRVTEGNGRKIKKKEQPFVDFSDKIKRAVPLRKKKLLDDIRAAAVGRREYTEVKTYYEGRKIKEKVVTVKEEQPSWQAAAWLLERLHFDEFGKRQRIDSYTWRDRIVEALKNGRITPEQVKERFSMDIAQQFFTEAGVTIENDN